MKTYFKKLAVSILIMSPFIAGAVLLKDENERQAGALIVAGWIVSTLLVFLPLKKP